MMEAVFLTPSLNGGTFTKLGIPGGKKRGRGFQEELMCSAFVMPMRHP